MHLTYGEAKVKERKTWKLYEQRFPTRIPNHSTFANVDHPTPRNSLVCHLKHAGRSRNVRRPEMESVFARITEVLSTSTRALAYKMGISQKDAKRILHEEFSTCIFNLCNQHVWSDSSPHCTITRKLQQTFLVNIRSGTLGDNVVNPHSLPLWSP